ncbi:MAG: carbohydrate ABC transporter permease [Acinetobacter sp.]
MTRKHAKAPLETLFDFVNGIIMIFVVIVTLYPFWYILVCSFSSIKHVMGSSVILWPDGLHFEAYQQVFRNSLVPVAYGNTFFVVIVGTVISMVLTILGAFVLSRKNLPGRKQMTLFVVVTMLFNGGLIPFYLTVRGLGMLGSLWSLIIPTALSTYNMIILRNAFSQIPESLFESASIDGATMTVYLVRILLPITVPALATITLFYAVSYWNAYFHAIIFIQDKTMWPIQAILREIIMTSQLNNMLFDDANFNIPTETLKDAMIIVAAAPIICVYPFVQRFFVKGIMVGSLKG